MTCRWKPKGPGHVSAEAWIRKRGWDLTEDFVGTKKHKAEKVETRHGTAAGLEHARDDARHAFNNAVDRLERKATKRLHQIITTTLEDATAVTAAMHQALAESQSASSEALDEMETTRREIREQLAQICDETQLLRVAIDDARVATEAAADEFDASSSARLEKIVAQRERTLECMLSEASDRVTALYARMEEQAATVEADVDRLRAQAGQAVESILAEAEMHRAAIAQAGDATTAAAHEFAARGHEQLEETDRQSKELAVQFEGIVARLRGQAEAQITEAGHKIEQHATEHEHALEQLHAEVTKRMMTTQPAIDEAAQQACEQAARHLAELLASVDRDAQELERLARVRIQETLKSVDEQAITALNQAAERATELLAQTQAYGEALHAEQQKNAGLAEPLTTDTPGAGDRAADTTPGALSPHSRLDHEIPPEPPESTEPVHWSPPPEPSQGDVATAPEAVEGELYGEASFDEGFFGRLAAELRADEDSDLFPPGDHHDEGTLVGEPSSRLSPPLPASGPAQHVALLGSAPVESRPHAPATVPPVATGPVQVVASLAGLKACIQMIGQSAAEACVRIEVTRTTSAETTAPSRLRLTTYDPGGWWKYGDIPASADTEFSAEAVVDLEELHEALSVIDRFVGGSEASIFLDGNVTIGNHLLLAQDADELPRLSNNRARIEPIDLPADSRPGLVLETQLGRLLVPPNLVVYLRRQQAADTELIAVDGIPCLSAHISASTADPSLTIVAPLQQLGEHDNPILNERRTNSGNEVTHLVSALSTASTAEDLERILKVGVGYVRRRAAAHPALPQEHILDLIRRGTAAMRAAAAANVSITKQGADLAIADPSSAVRAAVAANPSIPQRNLEQLASDPIAQVRARVASNTTTPSDLLEHLADDQDASVRAAVAGHENVPIDTLLVLARDAETTVCAAVATNPSCPTEVLNELVSIVPDSVLANPNASPTLLAAGSVIDASRLRATVAANPATPAKRLRKLARDTDPDVLRAIATHPGAPSSARRRARRALNTN